MPLSSPSPVAVSPDARIAPVAPALADALGTVARSFQAEADTDAILGLLVVAATRLVPGAQDASISLVVKRKEVWSLHQTSTLTEQVDVFQTEVGEGPCLDAIDKQRSVRVADMRHEQRWPTFARRAHALGVASMASFQLYVRDDTLGALNLFSRRSDAFDDESERIGLLLASHAAVAFANGRRLDHLARAVESRDLIGQAKGILMERYRIDQQRAFSLLMRLSQATHRKLHDVADELVSTGRLATPVESEADAPRQQPEPISCA